MRLFSLQNSLEISLLNGTNLRATLTDSQGNRVGLRGPSVETNRWVHIALSFDSNSKVVRFHKNGDLASSTASDNFTRLVTSGRARIGLENSTGLLLMDEFKISNVARRNYEIAYYANKYIHQRASNELKNLVPAHLSRLRDKAVAVEDFSPAAANLGEELFNDKFFAKLKAMI